MLLRILFVLGLLLGLPMSQAYGDEKTGDVYVGVEFVRPMTSSVISSMPVVQFDCTQAASAGSGACTPVQGTSWVTQSDIKAGSGMSPSVQAGVHLPFNVRVEAEVLWLERSGATGNISVPADALAEYANFSLSMNDIKSENLLFNVYYDYRPQFSENKFLKSLKLYAGGGMGAATTRILNPRLGVSATQANGVTSFVLPEVSDGQHIYQIVGGVDIPVVSGFEVGVKGRFLNSFGNGFMGYSNSGYDNNGSSALRVSSPRLNRFGSIGLQLKFNIGAAFRN